MSILILKSEQLNQLTEAANNISSQQLDIYKNLNLSELTTSELQSAAKALITNIEKNEELVSRLAHVVGTQQMLSDNTDQFYIVLADYYNELSKRMLDIETTAKDLLNFANFLGDISRRLIEKAAVAEPSSAPEQTTYDDSITKWIS